MHQHGLFSVRSMYKALTTSYALPFTEEVWKVKLPLKIKNLMWYLYKGVTLTKDNLARRSWFGSMQCCYYNPSESIQHLFLDCHMARFIWRIIHVSFNIDPPHNFQHMFSDWLRGFTLKHKYLIWFGVSTFCWAIWLCRNNMIFYRAAVPSFMQIIFKRTYLMRQWYLRLKKECMQFA